MAVKQNELTVVRRPCVAYLRKVQDLNQLKRFDFLRFICPPDYGKKLPHQGAILVQNGYEKGTFDMTIICANNSPDKGADKVFMIEFKYSKGTYSKEQKALADSAKGTAITTLIIRNIDEFKEFVERELK